MDCFPACEVGLGQIGTANVRTKFEICQNPPLLSLSIKNGGKITSSSFVAGNEIEVRPIRSSLRQLNLHVQFTKNNATGAHHLLAGFENIKTGNITYFMNNTLNADASPCSDANRNNQSSSDFLWVLLCIILVTCLLFVGISVFTIMSKFNSSQKSSSRKTSNVSIEKTALPRKKSNQCTVMISEPNNYLLSPNYYNDERSQLAVIAEVDEKDQLSEASLSCRESSNSLNKKLEQERRKISSDSTKSKLSSLAATPTAQKTSFIYQKDQVILPQNLTNARRNSQPLIFPTSSSLELLNKPQMPTFAV